MGERLQMLLMLLALVAIYTAAVVGALLLERSINYMRKRVKAKMEARHG